jgi:hypothetical protein
MNLRIGDIVEIKHPNPIVKSKQKLVGRIRKIKYIKYIGNKPEDWIEHEVYVNTNSEYVRDSLIFYFPFELKVLYRKN